MFIRCTYQNSKFILAVFQGITLYTCNLWVFTGVKAISEYGTNPRLGVPTGVARGESC